MRLFLASLFTIILLSGFLAAIVFTFLFIGGYIDAYLLIFLVVALNFILWLVSPTISDIMYSFFFHMKWITLEDLRKNSKSSAELIENVCRKYNFNIPKLGLIDDKNPNAFTYGSGRWNARIVVTNGIFQYLEDDNIAAVYGHELGHVKNRDFIVMTAAATIIQLLYVFYVIGTQSSKTSRKGGGYLLLIGVASYVLYWIGQYIVLYLSRIREYYADQFSGEETKDPNSLSFALIKIAYGILTNPDDVKLVNTTKNMGIMNFSAAKSLGMTYYMAHESKNPSLLDNAFLFDLHNPWAFISELMSTHPLTAKRIKRLCSVSKRIGTKPAFDFDMIEKKSSVNKRRLRTNFLKDLAVLSLPVCAAIIYPFLYAAAILTEMIIFNVFQFFSLWMIIIGLAMIIKTIYRYPGKAPQKLTVFELMSDVYASPVRGRRVILKGKFIGRGVPGFIFSEDLMMQDRTGLIYLNYQSWFPLLGNLFFALKKVKDLIGGQAEADGWFLRGGSSWMDLSSMKTREKTIKSYIKPMGLFWGLVSIMIGFALAPWMFLL